MQTLKQILAETNSNENIYGGFDFSDFAPNNHVFGKFFVNLLQTIFYDECNVYDTDNTIMEYPESPIGSGMQIFLEKLAINLANMIDDKIIPTQSIMYCNLPIMNDIFISNIRSQYIRSRFSDKITNLKYIQTLSLSRSIVGLRFHKTIFLINETKYNKERFENLNKRCTNCIFILAG